jgi:hypothetical protein
LEKKPPIKKKIRSIIAAVLLFMLLIVFVLMLPVTQTYFGQRFAKSIHDRFGTNIEISSIQVSPFGYVKLHDILAYDHKQDTLLYAGYLRLNTLRLGAILQGKNEIGNVFLKDVVFNSTIYENESKSNVNQFFNRFIKEKHTKSKTEIVAASISLVDASVVIQNQNKSKDSAQRFTALNADIQNFRIVGDVISADIQQLNTQTNWHDTALTSLAGTYQFSPTQMKLENAVIQTKESVLDVDIRLTYPKGGLKDFVDKVSLNIDLQPSSMGSSDLIKIMPNWKGQFVEIKGTIDGPVYDFATKGVQIRHQSTTVNFDGKIKNILDEDTRSLEVDLKIDAAENTASIPFALSAEVSEFLMRLDDFSTDAKVILHDKLWNVKADLKTALGRMQSNASFALDSKVSDFSINLASDDFDIGKLTAVPTIGRTGLGVVVSGNGFDMSNLKAAIEGKLTNFNYREYSYDTLAIEGTINPKFFLGNMHIQDESIVIDLNGQVDYASDMRNFSFNTEIQQLDFKALGWLPNGIDGIFSGSVDLALQGNNIDEMIGDLYIDEGTLITPGQIYSFSSLSAQSRLTNGLRVLNINSDDVATGLVIGNFKPSEMGVIAKNALGSQFKRYKPLPMSPNQHVDFNFNLRGKIASALFGGVVSLDDNTFIKGSIKPSDSLFKLEVRAPSIAVNNTQLNGLSLKIDTKQPIYHSNIRIDEIATPKAKLYDVEWINAQVSDKLYGRIEFGAAKEAKDINIINTAFTINDSAQAILEIQDVALFFNNNRWTIDKQYGSPTLTATSTSDFAFSNLNFMTENSAITANASQNGNDSFAVDVKFSNVYLRDLLSFQKDRWEGTLNGFLNIRQSSSGFGGNSSLRMTDLALNGVSLGQADLRLQSNKENQDYQLALQISDDGKEALLATGTIGIQNAIPTWDIDVAFSDYNMSLIAGLTNDVFSPFRGKANGNLQLSSTAGKIIPKGEFVVDELTLGVPYLNTLYNFTAAVPFRFSEDLIRINTSPFSSGDDQTAQLTGVLTHQSFSNWGLDMNINATQLEVLNTPFTEESLYYGNAYFKGDAHLYGAFSNMQIDVVGETATGTSIFIPIQYDTKIGDVSFINFIDKQVEEGLETVQLNTVKGLQLNFELDVTPEAEVEIVVDPETKSFLRGRGAGSILMEIDTAGSFAMWGDFIAFEGIYNFKNLGLIDKTFRLEPGGVIFWEGDPYGAQINMQAIYEVPGGANPAVLLEGDNISQKIPTDVSITLFGNLLNPETPTFEINFPNASGVVRNELNYRLNDEERRQLQAISLLSQGSFINEVSLAAISSQTLTTNLFEKASGIFDNIFTNENDKLNLGIDYLQGDRNAAVSIKNRDRLGVSLSTNINERILIDGKVGVPVGNEEETMIIGNVKLEFLLNKKGDLRARVFNKENEFQYFGDDLGYTQGIGVGYQVRFDSFQELVSKIFNKKDNIKP